MGARDSSFMNKVSYLAKWLIQSITTFTISKFMYSFSIPRFMQKSVLNVSRSLAIKVHTTHRVMANDYLHNLSVKQTNNFTHVSLIHVLSLIITVYLFKAYDLILQFTQFMQLIKPKSFSNTKISNQNKPLHI